MAFSGLYGGCTQCQGALVGIPLVGNGNLISFTVPTAQEGAMWGTADPVFGPDGDMYAAAGNSAHENPSQPFDGSDSVSELTSGMPRIDVCAPSTWAADNASDLDLGST